MAARSLHEGRTGLALQEIGDAARGMLGQAIDRDLGLGAALAGFDPHQAAHARPQRDAMRDAAQRHDLARREGDALGEPREPLLDPADMALDEVARGGLGGAGRQRQRHVAGGGAHPQRHAPRLGGTAHRHRHLAEPRRDQKLAVARDRILPHEERSGPEHAEQRHEAAGARDGQISRPNRRRADLTNADSFEASPVMSASRRRPRLQ